MTRYEKCFQISRFVRNQVVQHNPKITHSAQALHDTTSAPDRLYADNHLITKHARCGQLEDARQLFEQMPQKNIVTWTSLVSGYAQHGKVDQCFSLFSEMLSHYRPNDFGYASVLSACDYSRGVQVHSLALKSGFYSWVYVANALITMYWKNSSDARVEAWKVFDNMEFRNLVTYNSMIAGFCMHEQGYKAMSFFITMCRDGFGLDLATLLSLLSSLHGGDEGSCYFVGLQCCLQLHCVGIKTGLALDVRLVTALVKAYSTLGGEVDDCNKLFLETSGLHRDVVLWTGIMTAFVERDPGQALFLFNQLRREGICLDCYVYSTILKACAGFVTERHASALHCQVIKAGFVDVIALENVLVHAYARCGSIDKAKSVFDEMKLRDIVSWNSMLKAYAMHGKAGAALKLFDQMDVKEDEATFVALLSACSHAGLVDEGTKIFDTMYEKHGIFPQLDHYACIVDILGRAGQVRQAEKIIRQMPMQPDYVVWSSLLGACRKYGEAHLANLASSKLKELDPKNSLGYVLLSNICCSTGSFDEAGIIRKKMDGVGVRKEPGLSWTEVRHKVHEFASGGWQHPQREAICVNLEDLLGQLKKIGYVPETNLVLHDVEEEQKEEQLYHHSEKLALVFCLMNGSDSNCNRGIIRIMKNIRICLDCHTFMRLASKLVQREIIIRDANRFHHFKDGACSCNDYW
ncbi:Pentatricopeptide repeat-containing protein [Abeliophyllum distichum]|uniref:Pentatricopeptide repeat-containing protein n=1 Tax=Abeliophyllum distichum TaxID=126358 RepID=A0ABD1P339_9LAMI